MANLCEILKDLSAEIFRWMTDQPSVKEESITDWLLYELSKRSSQVAYKAFTRHEEAKYTGADWDWVFVFDDGTVWLRVQAKKLFVGEDNYPGLARSNRYGQQISALMTSAAKVSAYPIYAFYSEYSAVSACRLGVKAAVGAYLCGAKVVDANFVSTRTRVDPVNVIARSYPLSCVACCPKAKGGSAKDLIGQIYYYFENDSLPNSHVDEYLGYSKDIPSAIRAVVDNKFKFPDWWEQEFIRQFEDVEAVVMVDFRG